MPDYRALAQALGTSQPTPQEIERMAALQSPAFGVFPQMQPYRSQQDITASANVPVDVLRGRIAGTRGLFGDVVNQPIPMVRPLQLLSQAFTGQQKYPDTEHYLETMPLKSNTPIGDVAGRIGSFAPINPMPAVRAGQKGLNMLGMEVADRLATGRSVLPSLLKEPQTAMFAVNPTERGIVREGNPIQSAVVLIGDKIFTGRTHGDALNRAIYEGVVRKEGGKFIYPKGAEIDQDLFMTKDGQIIDRLQASKMLDIGASETAIEKGLMQNNPASSMTVDSYMQQAKKLKQQKEALPVEKTRLPSLQIEDKVLPVTMHKLEEKAGNQIVNISPETFDKAFSKTDWQYVGKGGEGGIEGRYKGFENWLKDAKSMTASNVSVNKDGGIVFGDGRHRYAVLRDMGLDKLPISMDKESIENAKKFGYLAE
jgi:hypothetical protein